LAGSEKLDKSELKG